jgi:hypothetical protein
MNKTKFADMLLKSSKVNVTDEKILGKIKLKTILKYAARLGWRPTKEPSPNPRYLNIENPKILTDEKVPFVYHLPAHDRFEDYGRCLETFFGTFCSLHNKKQLAMIYELLQMQEK